MSEIGWTNRFINPSTDMAVMGYGIHRYITTDWSRITYPLEEEGGLLIHRTISGLISEIVTGGHFLYVAIIGTIVDVEPVEWILHGEWRDIPTNKEINLKIEDGIITHWGLIHPEDYMEWKLKL